MSTEPLIRCLRCNRQLSNSRSISHGYGPICWSKIQHQRTLEEYYEHDAYERRAFEVSAIIYDQIRERKRAVL